MAVDAKTFLTELAQQAGLPADQLEATLKALDNPQFAKGIQDGVVRQSEFSRQMDALAANRTQWQKWHDENVGYVKELEAKAGVDPTRRVAPNTDGTVTLTKAELEKRLKTESDKTMAIGVNITKAAVRVMDDYRARFGKALDLDALEKLALEKGLPINAAYEELIKPEVQAAEAAASAKKIEDGIKAGVSAELSKRNLPLDQGPAAAADPSPFWGGKAAEQPLSEGQRARNFADTWNQTAGA